MHDLNLVIVELFRLVVRSDDFSAFAEFPIKDSLFLVILVSIDTVQANDS